MNPLSLNSLNALKITGGVVSVLLLTSIYLRLKNRQQDQRATQLLQALHRVIKPTTTGLLSEKALDVNYADDLLRRVDKKVLVLNKEVAIQLAQRIGAAWGAWYQGGDDEAKVFGVFRKLKDKVQVSQVAKAYEAIYRENLIEKLQGKFGEAEIKTLLKIINPLPNYRSI